MENPIKMDDLGVSLFLETQAFNLEEIDHDLLYVILAVYLKNLKSGTHLFRV